MRRSFPRALFSILATCAAVAAPEVFSSCDIFNYSDPVDSRLYSDNLISSIGFDQFVGSDTALSRAAVTTGKWDFAYCYDSWSDKFAYMTFAPVTDSGYTTAGALATTCQESLPSGLSSGASVYRLGLVNLISNGDFETGTLSDSGTWTKSKASSAISANLSAPSTINGSYSVKITVESGESITFTPATVSGYSFNKNLAYPFTFRYAGKNDGKVYDSDKDETNAYAESTSSFDSWAYYKGDYSPSAGVPVPLLAFKAPTSGGSIEGFSVDDFMLKRKDGMTLRLRLQPNQTSTTMIEGRYQFSVWVHADPLASSSANPFPADTFTVTMNNVVNGYNAASSTATYKRSMTGWQKLTVQHKTDALQFKNRSDQTLAVIEIDIDCNSSLPGRVLLASPDFRMVSE